MKKTCLLLSILFYTLTCFGKITEHQNFAKKEIHTVFDHDAQVVIIYPIAQIPILSSGNESDIRAVIKNSGAQTLTNIPVLLVVTGLTSFTNTKFMASLAPGASSIVVFNAYAITALGINHITVSVPDDDDNSNNIGQCMIENTLGLYSYADTAAIAGNFGFGTSSGFIAAQYPLNFIAKVTGVRVHISNDPANIGQTVYGIAFYGPQFLIGQSPSVVLTAADLDKWMFFPITPAPNINSTFRVALAQTASSTAYYPVSYQREIPTRNAAYISGSLTPPYTFDLDSITGRYMIQAVMDNAVVPIILESFAARRNGKVNELVWNSSQEINSKEFVIERSNDGNAFTPIGKVKAAGNSNTISTYRFTDYKPIQGINYYRLRFVDLDGQFSLSEIRTVNNLGGIDFSVYPNPVINKMKVTINAGFSGRGMIYITDLSGKMIYDAFVNLEFGNNIFNISTDKFSAGTYILKLKLNNDVIVKQFSKR